MSSATTLSLNEVVSRALPDRIPQAVRTRLRRRIVLLVRRYQLDHQFFQEGQREKKAAREDGIIDIAEDTISALDKARQRLGLSTAYRDAVDRATSAQIHLELAGRLLPSPQAIERAAPTEKTRRWFLREIDKWERRNEELKRDSSIAYQLARAGVADEAQGEVTLQQSLDLTLSRAMTEIRKKIEAVRVPRGGDESDVTQLVRELLNLMRGADLTEKEAKALLGALRGVERLLIPSEEALKQRKTRARKDLREIRDRAATGKIQKSELSQLKEDILNLMEFAWLTDDEMKDLDDALRNVPPPTEPAGGRDTIDPDSVNPVPSPPH